MATMIEVPAGTAKIEVISPAALAEAVPAAPKVKKEKKPRTRKWRDSTLNKKWKVQESHRLITSSEGNAYFYISFPEADIAKYEESLKAIKECALWHRSPMPGPKVEEGQPVPDTEWKQVWRVRETEETLQVVAKFGKKFRFDFSGDILVRAQMSTSDAKELEKMSYASSAPDQKLPPLPKGKVCCKCETWTEGSAVKKCPNCRHKSCTKCKGLKPLKFQPAGLAYALRAKRTFIADEMGLGKTIQALLVIAYVTKVLRQKGQWLVIVPAAVKINWLREVTKWLGKATKVGLAGNSVLPRLIKKDHTPLSQAELKKALSKGKRWIKEQQVVIVNYDRVPMYKQHLENVEWKGIILDESHYCKGPSARTRSVRDLAEHVKAEYVLLLSGTPVLNSPGELIRQLQIMDRIHEFGGPVHFTRRYCGFAGIDYSKMPKLPKPAEDGTVAAIPEADAEIRDALIRKAYEDQVELNRQLRSICYVRREKADVLTSLPDKTRQTILLDITNRKEYEKIERDVISYLMARVEKDEKFLKKIAHMSNEDKVRAIKERRNEVGYKSARAQALVKLEMCKQAAAIGKMEGAMEWIDNTLENNEKVILFGYHNNIQDELASRLSGRSVQSSSGSDTARQARFDEFNASKKAIAFVGSLKRDGVGVNLQSASNVAFLELGWTPAIHDQAEDRAHRIGQKNAVNCYYLIAKNTVEERIARLIEKKRMIVDASAYGDPIAKSREVGNILGDLITELTGKKSLD